MAIFIYGLECPVDIEVRYVGKSNNPTSRLASHIAAARTGRTNHYCAHWIRKLLALNLSPRIVILAEVASGELWQEVERRIIKDAVARGWRLTNATPGGEGAVFLREEDRRKWSEQKSALMRALNADPNFIKSSKSSEASANRSASAKKKWQDPKYREKMLVSSVTRERLSAAKRKNWENPEYRAKLHMDAMRQKASANSLMRSAALSAAMTQRWASPDFREKMSISRLDSPGRREKMYSPEALAKRAATRRNNPELKAKMVEVNKRPEVIERRSIAMSARWANPEYKSRLVESAKRRSIENPSTIQAITAASHTPEVRARAAATLKATWARKKAAKVAAKAAAQQ